jgi:hypothetical protein
MTSPPEYDLLAARLGDAGVDLAAAPRARRHHLKNTPTPG